MLLSVVSWTRAPPSSKLNWLSIEHCSVLKTVAYMFLHTGFPSYLASYLSTNGRSYITRCSQSIGNFLVAPKFHPSIQKSVKQFGYNFAFDVTTVWDALPGVIYVAPPPLLPLSE